MTDEELYDLDIDNAFDLLATIGSSKYVDDVLELDINIFRQYSDKYEDLLPRLIHNVERHKKLSRDTFETLLQSASLDDAEKLFISYIIDEQIFVFGDRWMAKSQIEDIEKWESKYNLDDTLSINYGTCLNMFIKKHLVYESGWTSYGNPREYTLCASLRKYLFSSSFKIPKRA